MRRCQMSFNHVNPLQWHQAVGVARQSCARFFRDGGAPADALLAFGLSADDRVRTRLEPRRRGDRRDRSAPRPIRRAA